MDVGRRIREVREDLGMPAAVLARRIGVAPNTVWRYESGEREPSMAMLEKIARELRTEPAELLREPVPLAEAPRGAAPSEAQTSEGVAEAAEERRQDRVYALLFALERAAESGEKVEKAWKVGRELDYADHTGWEKDDMVAQVLMEDWGVAVGDDPKIQAAQERLSGVRRRFSAIAHQLLHARPEHAREEEQFRRLRRRYARDAQPRSEEGSPESGQASGA
jgi:transcriptional regulator with XRE-family HTH domain